MRSPLNWGSLSFYSDWNGFSCLEFLAERKQSKNNGSQIIRLHVELGITDTQLSTLFLHVFTSFHYEMSKPRMRGKTGPGCLPFVPPKHTWDPPNKAGSHNLQQPERWAPWQKGRQIVCLPSDKQHWLCSTEMISNMGFCIFWPSAWHPFSCSHLWRALKIQVTHFVEISRKIQAFWTAFLFQGYTGSCNSIHNGLPWLSTEHTGLGQNPAWALWLCYTTVAKAHQLHSKKQTGEGCCCHTRLTLIPQTAWNCDTFQWDVPAVSWFSGSRANCFSCSAILCLSCPFCLPDSVL